MKLVLWLAAIGTLLWSALGWLAWTIAGAGEAAVVTLSRWLDIDPGSTQWIAEAFALAGSVAQWLVLLVWLMGMGVIGLLAWLGSQAATTTLSLRDEIQRKPGIIIDGEVRDRSLD